MAGNIGIRIPPGASDYHLDAAHRFATTWWCLISTHMHLRGKSFRFEVEQPDGRRETLLDVPRYDFNWQLRYDLVEPLRLRKGSRLLCFAVFDNSESNPRNPDPRRKSPLVSKAGKK